jgi:hypothetical protein
VGDVVGSGLKIEIDIFDIQLERVERARDDGVLVIAASDHLFRYVEAEGRSVIKQIREIGWQVPCASGS